MSFYYVGNLEHGIKKESFLKTKWHHWFKERKNNFIMKLKTIFMNKRRLILSSSSVSGFFFELCLSSCLCCWPCHPEYREKYAKPEDIGAVAEEKSSDDELSEDESDSGDEQVVGQADP